MVVDNSHPAIQHRNAVVALSILDVALEQLEPVADKKLLSRIKTVQKWTAQCWLPLRRKRISAGFKGDLREIVNDILDRFIDRYDGKVSSIEGWAAFYWLGLALELKARIACPLYAKGKDWSWLDRTAWGLGDCLMAVVPECDVAGTELYEEVA